jgi:transcriptional regulator with XRE-family HTH domain
MFNRKTVAANIRAARIYRNYSQDYVGYKIGISQNGYSKIELGHTNVTLEKVAMIAEVLEVDLAKLVQEPDVKNDVEAIQCMAMVPKLLEVICRSTGMGFAAVARVTENKWIACGVRDEISFGLKPGSELKLETTICHEIRQCGVGVVIEHVAEDEIYMHHHTPALYGFQSYISVPIIRRDGGFFGTLCAIDPHPHKVNTPETIGMFTLFAELIAFHLQANGFYLTGVSELQKVRKLTEQATVIIDNEISTT